MHVVIYHFYRANAVAWADHLFTRARGASPPLRLIMCAAGSMVSGIASTGAASVGLFFILSGFILAYCYLTPQGDLNGSKRSFWVNRFARIYPTYLLGFLLITPITVWRMLPPGQPLWGKFVGTGLANFTLLQSWYAPAAATWNSPGWSLSDEAFFYLLFPFIAVALLRGSGRIKGWLIVIACMVTIAAFAVAQAALAPRFTNVDVGAWFSFFPLIRLPEFILGIALGRVYAVNCGRLLTAAGSGPGHPKVADPLWQRGLAPFATLGIIIVLSLPVIDISFILHPWIAGARAVALPLLFAALIYGLATDCVGSPRGLARLLGIAPLVLLGEASYAVYILHMPIGKWFGYITQNQWTTLAHSVHLSSGGVANGIVYFLTTILGAVAIFEWLEKPARRWLRQRLDPSREPQIAKLPQISVPTTTDGR